MIDINPLPTSLPSQPSHASDQPQGGTRQWAHIHTKRRFILPLQRWFQHLSVGQKISYGYAIALGIAVAGTALGVILGARYQQQALDLEMHAREELEIVHTLQKSILKSRIHQQRLIPLLKSPKQFQPEYNQLLEYVRNVQQSWLIMQNFAKGEVHEDGAHQHQFAGLLQKYEGAIDAYAHQITTLQPAKPQSTTASPPVLPTRQQLLDSLERPITFEIDQLTDDLTAILQVNQQEYEAIAQSLHNVGHVQLQTILISSAIAIAIATILAYFTSRAISQPLKTTTRIAQTVTDTANFDLQVPIATQDEVGVLAHSLNVLIRRFKQLLVEQKASEQKLRESRQLLQLVIDTIPQMIFWKDQNSVFLGCNQRLAEFAGYQTPEDLINKTDDDLPWKRQEADFYRECDQRVMATGEAELGTIESLITSDGQQLWLETNKVPLSNAQGHVIGILGTLQDITERKQAEIKLQRLNTELEQRTNQLSHALAQLRQSQLQLVQTEKMSSLGQLVAGVAHEINNPINFIHGNLSHAHSYAQDLLGLINLYQQYYPQPHPAIAAEIAAIDLEFLTEDLTKLLQSMRMGTDRIREIVLSLRNFSRLDEAEVKNVNIHEGLDSTLTILHNRLKARAEHPEIQVIKEYGQLPLVECYPGQLNQVFMNLLSNAIDALEEHMQGRSYQDVAANPAMIRIQTVMLSQGRIAIHIVDNGPGIPIAIQSKLFDPFFTTKAVGKGTGLGLSISHKIVTEKHRGKLYCDSTSGMGTTFVVELPIALHQSTQSSIPTSPDVLA